MCKDISIIYIFMLILVLSYKSRFISYCFTLLIELVFENPLGYNDVILRWLNN